MPPPAAPAGNAKPLKGFERLDTMTVDTPPWPRDEEAVSTSPTMSTKKKAGFKPIGETPSLRRFFSTDEVETAANSPNGHHPLPLKPGALRQAMLSPESLRAQGRFKSEENAQGPRSASPPPTIKSPATELLITPQAKDSRTLSDVDRSPPLSAMEVDGSRAASVDPSPTPNTQNDAPRDKLYALVNQVGEGTFGKVYKAQNTVTGRFVALKRIRMETEKDGFPITSMREIKLLQSLRHENVVHLQEMMVSDGAFFSWHDNTVGY